jgi:NADH-quinone oxidoreductase subunit A
MSNIFEYAILGYFFLISLILSSLLLIISFILSSAKPDAEKVSPYECGFEPFNDSRITFDVHFYIVAILFMIFDLEIAYLFP